MHTIQASRPTPDMAAKVLRHHERVLDVTPPHKLADELSGQLRLDRFHVLVPSDSHPGFWWEVRVSWHGPRPGAPYGYVEAGHYGHACAASEAGKDCWHLYAAVARVATIYDPSGNGGKVPEAARPVRLAPPADGRAVWVDGRLVKVAPRPTGTDPDFYG
jgi:hypothetical protein